MSRKTIQFMIGLLTAILAVICEATGVVSVDWKSVGAVGLAIISYLQFQAKLDIQKIAQSEKFKDPKFYVSLLAVAIAEIGAFLGVDLPVAEISAVLTLILSLFFSKKLKESPA